MQPDRIDKSKQYRTRDGKEVRIYATDGNGDYPVHGAILVNGRWRLYMWTADGLDVLHATTPSDLIEVRRRIRVDVWLNVYEYGVSGFHDSRELADAFSGVSRLACIHIVQDVEEGEGP